MHSRSFLPPRSLLGMLATLAISIALVGVSAHDHALDDGAEAHSRVCVVAGTAVLPTTGASAAVSTVPPVARIEVRPTSSTAACEAERRSPRARGPPAIEFGTI